jgi:MinD superfamily P-loop ATPase
VKVAIASGKGGTGKTTLATNLAVTVNQAGRSVAYVDCDVEEPNGHLFLKPRIERRTPVTALAPALDPAACDGCGRCAPVCQFSALLWLGTKPLFFPELCHGCGGCARSCPAGAICERPRTVGFVETGRAGDVQFVHGLLNVGEAKSPPVVRAVRAAVPAAEIQILDAPPGTSCPVVATVRGCDFVVLVTEPTPFGLHDLRLAVETLRRLALPHGVVINRAGAGDERVATWCATEELPVLLSIPDDRRIAEAYSRGALLVTDRSELLEAFAALWTRIEVAASAAKTGSAA